MTIESMNRALFKTGLQWLRLPLTTLEMIAGQERNTDRPWPPALAFEGFEASAKQLAGWFSRDTTLVQEGRLQRAKLDQLGRADHLQAEAEQKRVRADDTLDERRKAAAERRDQIEQQADQRRQALERQKADAKRRVQDETHAKAEAAGQADQARAKVVAAKKRQVRSTRLAAESSALEQQRRAVSAAGKAAALDEAVQAKSAGRKAR